jgi:DnaJ-domain-containing protein 1
MRFTPDEPETPPAPRRCDHPGCDAAGDYRAPRDRAHLRDYYYFCLDHVREYNRKWDFFAGFNQDQMYQQMRKDTAWERPTWPAMAPLRLEKRLHDFIRKFTKDTHENAPPPTNKPSAEAAALDTLGLMPDADQKTIKKRYRELVKRYHPDTNPDNPKGAERFKRITQAYDILKTQWRHHDKDKN